MSDKIHPNHLARKAILYVRQSSAYQVNHNLESQRLQYAMRERLVQLGWHEIEIVDEDLGRSAAGLVTRSGFERMVADVCLGKVGAVAAREVSRFARNSREWQQLVEVCRVVDTVLVDLDTVYAPRASNDRLLLGLKGSLNEYELDLLRQRSVEARRQKALRGELLIVSPVGYRKGEQRLEKDPDRRVQEAVTLVFRKLLELGSVRQTLVSPDASALPAWRSIRRCAGRFCAWCNLRRSKRLGWPVPLNRANLMKSPPHCSAICRPLATARSARISNSTKSIPTTAWSPTSSSAAGTRR